MAHIQECDGEKDGLDESSLGLPYAQVMLKDSSRYTGEIDREVPHSPGCLARLNRELV